MPPPRMTPLSTKDLICGHLRTAVQHVQTDDWAFARRHILEALKEIAELNQGLPTIIVEPRR